MKSLMAWTGVVGRKVSLASVRGEPVNNVKCNLSGSTVVILDSKAYPCNFSFYIFNCMLQMF